jgi:dolichol-phosphate mannosyltransferase
MYCQEYLGWFKKNFKTNSQNLLNSKRLCKFAFVGATGTVLNLTITYILTDYMNLWYIISAIIAIECSILSNFYLNTKITFKYTFLDRSDIFIVAAKYHLSVLVGLVINISTLFILTELFDIYYLLSEFVAICLAFWLNYYISVKHVWINID